MVGASGLVGSHVASALVPLGGVERTALRRTAPDVRMLDIRDAPAVDRVLEEVRPDVVVCAAADPYVERCEREPVETAAINVSGTANVARAAAARGALFVFFSSDYVFDGEHAPYGEADVIGPINEYGRQKVAAEELVRASPDHLICRVSGVFGIESHRKNFVYQVVDRIGAGERVRAAEDQILCPTAADALADTLVALIASGARGVWHVTGPDALTRAEFARRVARAFGLDPSLVDGVPTSELSLIANRPRDSSLRCDRLRETFGRGLPATDVSLSRLAARGLG